jgi:hypothetical protein
MLLDFNQLFKIKYIALPITTAMTTLQQRQQQQPGKDEVSGLYPEEQHGGLNRIQFVGSQNMRYGTWNVRSL